LCNQPLISYAIEPLLEAGVTDLVINLHHLPEPIEEVVRNRYGSRLGLHFSHEQDILGTAGGVRRARVALEGEEEVLLVNGDTVQSPPWNALREARLKDSTLAALALRHPPEDDRFTPVYFDGGRVTGF